MSNLTLFASNREVYQCKKSTCKKAKAITDNQSGDVYCDGCGRVLDARIMSEEQEWRSFSSDSGGGNDRNRVAGPSNHWFEDGDHGTSMVGGDRKLTQSHDMATAVSSTVRNMKNAFDSLKKVSTTLRLRESIVERCKEMVKELSDQSKLQKRTTERCMLALVYLACKEDGMSRAHGDLVKLFPSISEKELGQTIKAIRKVLPGRGTATSSSTADLMPKFCSKLKLADDVQSFAAEMAAKTDSKLEKAHRPATIAGAVLLLTVELQDVACPAKLICDAVNTGEATIREVYKELREKLLEVLPERMPVKNQRLFLKMQQELHAKKSDGGVFVAWGEAKLRQSEAEVDLG